MADAHQNHIDNGIPTQLDDYSSDATTMATTTNPGESGTESLATSLAGELERIRFILLEHGQALSGSTLIPKWYSSPTNARFINDDSNSSMTTGLTINQGSANNDILALKSSDVAHGVTTLAETDTYAYFRKLSSTAGGLNITGLTETITAFNVGAIPTTEDTTKSTLAEGAIVLGAFLKSGTTVGSMSANTNLVTIKNASAIRFIFDADGDSHQDVGLAWTNFDAHDDIALLHGLSAGVSRPSDPVREQFMGFLDEHRETLTDLKLVTFNDDGHHFVNMSKLAMLNTGAIRQLAGRLERVERLLLPSR